ncbi:MAG: hypothetical protein ABEK10_03430 [Candidatus Nanosalina sp.]
MGLERQEVLDLVEHLDHECPELEGLVERYRSVSGAFLENEFPGGSEEVYKDIPEKYRELAEKPPRYIDPPEVPVTYVESVSDRAAYSVNFVDLRKANIESAIQSLQEDNYLVVDSMEGSFSGRDILDILEGRLSELGSIERSLIGVARFLDVAEEFPGKPFNRMKELYQTGGDEDLRAAKRADPEDISFPQENYWPFGRSSGRREQLN